MNALPDKAKWQLTERLTDEVITLYSRPVVLTYLHCIFQKKRRRGECSILHIIYF
jgi:hypothetical protein